MINYDQYFSWSVHCYPVINQIKTSNPLTATVMWHWSRRSTAAATVAVNVGHRQSCSNVSRSAEMRGTSYIISRPSWHQPKTECPAWSSRSFRPETFPYIFHLLSGRLIKRGKMEGRCRAEGGWSIVHWCNMAYKSNLITQCGDRL